MGLVCVAVAGFQGVVGSGVRDPFISIDVIRRTMSAPSRSVGHLSESKVLGLGEGTGGGRGRRVRHGPGTPAYVCLAATMGIGGYLFCLLSV